MKLILISILFTTSLLAKPSLCLGPNYFKKYADFAAARGAKVSYKLEVFNLKNKNLICENSWHKDQVVYPASTMKVYVVAAALNLVDQGHLSLEDTYTIDQVNADVDCGNRPCGTWGIGKKTTLKRMLEVTIQYSNNITTNQLMDIVTKKQINVFAKSMGAKNTIIRRKVYATVNPEPHIIERNETTAQDLANFYYNIYFNEQKQLSESSREFFLKLIGNIKSNNRLNRHFKRKQKFYHKTGSTSKSASDAGFYILKDKLVIITALQESKKRVGRGKRWDFAQLARMGRDIFSKIK